MQNPLVCACAHQGSYFSVLGLLPTIPPISRQLVWFAERHVALIETHRRFSDPIANVTLAMSGQVLTFNCFLGWWIGIGRPFSILIILIHFARVIWGSTSSTKIIPVHRWPGNLTENRKIGIWCPQLSREGKAETLSEAAFL